MRQYITISSNISQGEVNNIHLNLNLIRNNEHRKQKFIVGLNPALHNEMHVYLDIHGIVIKAEQLHRMYAAPYTFNRSTYTLLHKHTTNIRNKS